MNKTLLSTLALSALIASGTAQVTITSSNVATIGKVIVQDHDTIPSVGVPATGASQTWNYSTGLVAHEDDTLSFINPAWTASASFFPTSNLAADDGGASIYLENSASGLTMLGFAGDLFGTGSEKQIYMNPVDEILRFPATYNDSYTTNSIQHIMLTGAEIGQSIDSLVMKNYVTKMVNINGYGTVTTPLGAFSAILVNETSYEADSTWMYVLGVGTLADNSADTSYNSSFWTDDASAGFPLMDISHDGQGSVNSVSWLKVTPFVSVEESTSAYNIYPNPASDVIRIEGNVLNTTIEIIDITGRVISSEPSGANLFIADVSLLDNGYYFVNIKDEEGKSVSVQKIEVLK